MGLINYAQPVADDSVTVLVGGGSPNPGSDPNALYGYINDAFGTRTVRGKTGGVETDLANDTNFLDLDTQSTAFVFNPIAGDDYISNVVFNIRGEAVSSSLFDVGQTATLQIVRKDAPAVVIASISRTIVSNSPAPALSNLSVTATTAGLNQGWTTDSLNGAGLGLRNPYAYLGPVPKGASFIFKLAAAVGSTIFRVSRIYLTVNFAVGPTLGRSLIHENWRYDDICGRKFPYSQLRRIPAPHKNAGLVVCSTCYALPDHDDMKSLGGRRPRERNDPLY